MNITLYQVNMDRDACRVCFMDYAHTLKYSSRDQVDSSIYDCTYSGDVEASDLERVYQIFNDYSRFPKTYMGRSLSVSDVVAADGKYYFCDSFGFTEIAFNEAEAQSLKEYENRRKAENKAREAKKRGGDAR